MNYSIISLLLFLPSFFVIFLTVFFFFFNQLFESFHQVCIKKFIHIIILISSKFPKKDIDCLRISEVNVKNNFSIKMFCRNIYRMKCNKWENYFKKSKERIIYCAINYHSIIIPYDNFSKNDF